DGVGVGAADAEGAEGRTARRAALRPGRKAVDDAEGGGGEVDLGVGRRVVDRGRDLAVAQAEGDLDEAGEARRGIQVADVRLDRAEAAELVAVLAVAGVAPEGLLEGQHLDG